MIEITRPYTAECAHRLPHVPDDHKCSRLHGHSYRFEVTVAGEPEDDGPERGMVIDFCHIDAAFKRSVHDVIDHRYLNEIKGLSNPTAENLARWVFAQVNAALAVRHVRVVEVVVYEGPRGRASYRPGGSRR